MASDNGNGSRMLRNPLIGGVLDEVDVRIARLLGGIDDAAERIAESVQEVEAEIARDERVIRRGVGVTAGAGNDARIDLRLSAGLGAGLMIDTISFWAVGAGALTGYLYLDQDPNANTFDSNLIVYGHGAFAASAVGGEVNMYVPNNRQLSARVVGTAAGQACGCAIFGRILSVQP